MRTATHDPRGLARPAHRTPAETRALDAMLADAADLTPRAVPDARAEVDATAHELACAKAAQREPEGAPGGSAERDGDSIPIYRRARREAGPRLMSALDSLVAARV